MSSQQLSSSSSSSLDIASEHVCYVQCNFCNTILAVSVPGTILFNVVTVRCGHCANLLSVNMASLLQTLPNHHTITAANNQQHQDLLLLHHHHQHHLHQQNHNHNVSLHEEDFSRKQDCVSSSSSSSSPTKRNKVNSHDLLPSSTQQASHHQQDDHHRQHPLPRMLPVRPPEKRQRVPSAYNRFIKEEIQRIKSSNPDISHREAFSTAAKNWAHFPHIHFGLTVDGNKQVKIDGAFAGEAGMQKTQDFY